MATLGSSASLGSGSSGDPGSAFCGLSRGRGRGRGAGGGSRGGRGRARGGLSAVNIPGTQPDNCESSTSPSTKSSILPTLSPTFSSKPKSASRRGSRAIPITAVPQINESVVTPSASRALPAKLTHKRRRSQAGKPAIDVSPKANPPKVTDSPLRPTKLYIESHTETLKDLPPHLNSKFDVRNDIDALVERVRSVAMDNRPSTPKNHIDWAVDDDDTLPDLDDWGVTTSTLTAQLEGISPIIVDGLRSLPDFAANSTVPNPPVMVQRTNDAQCSSVNSIAPDTVVPLNTKEEYTKPKFSPESMAKHERTAIPLNPKLGSSQFNSGISLHAKPLSVDSIVQLTSKSRRRCSTSRFAPHPKPPIIPVLDLSEGSSPAKSGRVGAREPVEIAFETTDHKTATRTPAMFNCSNHLIIVEPTVTESVFSNIPLDKGADSTQTAQESSPSSLSGLGASMHAPKGIVDSLSAPANLSTYADTHAHDLIRTHTRAHTVGRSPLPDMTRVIRSGHTTPRGGLSHARTHSTPPGGINHRSPHTSRPVITGDAISRLARTIGKTHNNLTPSISHPAVTSDRPAS